MTHQHATLSLTPRDLAILTLAYRYGGVTVELLSARFFAPTDGARRSAYDRVQRLLLAGYLASVRLPSLSGCGSGKLLLTPGPAARPLLAQALGLSQGQLARVSRAVAPAFVAHHLAICSVRLAFELAAERSGAFEVADWTTDAELKRAPHLVRDPQHPERLVPIVPDAAFGLTLADGTGQGFYFELDMGTVAPKRLRTKLGCYLLSTPFPVLLVVPDAKRQAAIVAWTLALAQELRADPTLIWVTTRELVRPETIFDAPIWQIVGGPSALALRDLAAAPEPLAVEPAATPPPLAGTIRPHQPLSVPADRSAASPPGAPRR